MRSTFLARVSLMAALVVPSLAYANGAVHVLDSSAGPGTDFTNFQTAVDAAVDGDLILMRSGVYDDIVIGDKSLTITADLGASISMQGDILISGLSASKSVSISGLDVISGSTNPTVQFLSCQGPILFENCSISANFGPFGFTSTALTATNCANVTIALCTISFPAVTLISGNIGVLATDSNVWVYESTIIGEDGASGGVGGDGLVLNGGALFASGSTFQGGAGASASSPFCITPGDGGDGLQVAGTATTPNPVVTALDCNFVAGPGGAAGGCPAGGNDGLPTRFLAGSLTTLPVNARTYSIPSPIRAGTSGNLTFTGLPGELAWVVLSGNQQPVFSSLLQGVLLPKQPSPIIFIGTIPITGTLNIPVNVTLNPGQECLVVYEQAVYYTIPTGFVLSNPRLGVIVDASL